MRELNNCLKNNIDKSNEDLIKNSKIISYIYKNKIED